MNYEQIRYYLFSKSYVGKVIIDEIRKKHKIDSNQTYSEWAKILTKDYFSILEEIRIDWSKEMGYETIIDWDFIWLNQDDIESKIFPEVSKLAQQLNFDTKMLMINILYNNVPKKLSTPNKVCFANKLRPIKEKGTYLRIDKNTTDKEVLEMLHNAKKYMFIVEDTKEKQPSNKLKILNNKKRKDISKNDNQNFEIFKLVENKIKKLIKEKEEKQKDFDYEGEIVGPALKNVAVDLAIKINPNDESIEFENKIFKKVKNIYYSILNRYGLPTYKQLKSILRLINS